MTQNSTIDEKEKEILNFWDLDKTFQKSLDQTKKGNEYVFYEGPPFATGLPHYGHTLVSVVKDAIPRYKTMRGFHVERRWGWDCHGLPIENIAEKELKINSKDEIEKMGVKKFNDFCRSKVLTYAKEWGKTIHRIARWTEFENSYKTMDNDYIESVWWAFKKIYKKGLIYKGEKILMYCPRCATPLSKSEVTEGNAYKKIKSLTVTVKFKLKNKDNTYALAWTTTPWTLPSNLALTVHPDLDYSYVKDKSDGNTYLLAKDLIEKFYKSKDEYKIEKTIEGKELEGKEYEPLFPYFKGHKNAFKFLLGKFVTAEEGTGIVHTAPAFGEDDYEVSKKYNISMVQPLDEKGVFTGDIPDLKGKMAHDVNEEIVIALKKGGKAISSRKIDHEYPHCHRCDTKLMYRALPAWFINIQKIKPRLLELNKKINWYPSFLKEGRFKHNLETAPDWNISRNRYWATAIPIWENDRGDRLVIGSIEELKKYARKLPKDIDLHKDMLDQVVLEKNGVKYKRIPEVLDCWFESGSMPFAQHHYPFENKAHFEKNFPSQYVAEYIGQTRTWFYNMLVLSTILFDKIPFENVQTTGTILAEDGSKMSKSKGNFTNPQILIERFGADALRFYHLSSTVMDAENTNFSDRQVEEIYKKVILLLYNVNSFYDLYKDIPLTKTSSKNLIDKWILSKTNRLTLRVTEYLEKYNTVKACAEIRSFIDDLSTWYVRNSRDRFNEKDSEAKTTLHYVLGKLSKVIAPIMPFVAERIHQTISSKNQSVHLEKWPTIDKNYINKKLEEEMNLVRLIVSTGLRERDRKQISLKWPLAKATINSPTEPSKKLTSTILEELNLKKIIYKHSKELVVELDTNLTPELEAEGYAREISRAIQASRKKADLVKEDQINLEIISEFNDKIASKKEFIQDRVGAKNLSFEESLMKFSHSQVGKIKGKKFLLKFNKI